MPVLQGVRLTAWELMQNKIPVTLITDNMAGSLMRQGKIRSLFHNPAFDVTPAELITGIITERGVFRPAELAAQFGS